MSRAVHNANLIDEDSDSSEFENEINAFNVCLRKEKTFHPRVNYFEVYDEEEFVKRFRLTKSTVKKVLNEIVDQLKTTTNRLVNLYTQCNIL